MFLAKGAEYFNPDEASSRIRSANPGLSEAEANSEAWNHGKRLLRRAIIERLSFAFETTLGGIKFPDGSIQTTGGLASVFHDASLLGNGASPWTATYSVDPSTCTLTKTITLPNEPSLGPLADTALWHGRGRL